MGVEVGAGLGLGLSISVKEVTGCNSVPHVSSHRFLIRSICKQPSVVVVNRICENTAEYELWSTSGSSKRMSDSAHKVPRVGALAQLNSHFDVGKVYSNPLSAGPECIQEL